MARHLHPTVKQTQIWSSPPTCPWTREALLRPVGANSLLCTWTTGGLTEPWAGNLTMAASSADGGVTWSEPAMLFAHPTRGLFTTELFVPRAGEVHAFLQTYGNGTWMSQLLSYRAISGDGGGTWAGPHSLPGGAQGVWVGRGVMHSTGRWILPVSWAELIGAEWAPPSVGRPPFAGRVGSRELPTQVLPAEAKEIEHYQAGNAWSDRNHRYCVGALVSDDDGASFQVQGYLRGGAHGWLMEPRVVELSDGSLRMLIRSQRDGWLWESSSTDAGITWTSPAQSGIPNPAAKVNLLRARDGRIYLLHNPRVHAGAVMGGRNPLSLWVSDDDMRTWRVKVDLVTDENPSACLNYPDGYIDEERGELHFVWEDMCTVFQVRVPLDIG